MLRLDAETVFLASSLLDAIAASLAGLESLFVRPTLTAARVESEPPDLRAIAEALEVHIVLMGSILKRDGRLRTTTQLVEAPGGPLVWTNTSDVPGRILTAASRIIASSGAQELERFRAQWSC